MTARLPAPDATPRTGLLAYASDPIGLPSPLPSLDRQIVRGAGELASPDGWPTLLVAPALAHDLADRGLTYARRVAGHRSGLALNGDSVLQRVVATMCADIMREAATALRERWRDDEALALERTARAVEVTSGAAVRNLIDGLRPHLPAPTAADAATWLESLDNSGTLSMTALRDAYDAHGQPGVLSKRALYALARARWDHGTVRGVDVVRTSSRRQPPAPSTPDIASHAIALGVDPDALAAWIATQRPTP